MRTKASAQRESYVQKTNLLTKATTKTIRLIFCDGKGQKAKSKMNEKAIKSLNRTSSDIVKAPSFKPIPKFISK